MKIINGMMKGKSMREDRRRTEIQRVCKEKQRETEKENKKK